MNAVEKAKARISLDTMVNIVNRSQQEARMDREARRQDCRNVVSMKFYLAEQAARPGVR